MRCSYCNNQGHRVNRCDNLSLLTAYELLKEEYILIDQSNYREELILFRNKFESLSIQMRKAICVRYCNCRLNECNDDENMFLKLLLKIREEFGDENNNVYIPNRLERERQRTQRSQSPVSVTTDIYSVLVENPELNDYLNPIPNTDNPSPIPNIMLQNNYFDNWLNNYFDEWFNYYMRQQMRISRPMRITGNYIKKEIKIKINKNEKEYECDKIECCICLNDNIEREKIITTKCKHEYCNVCIVRWCENKENNPITCPICRTKISELYVNNKSMINEIKKELYKEEMIDDNKLNDIPEELVVII